MAASRFVNPRPQFFDDSGKVLVGGEAFFFDSGTLTDKPTFADVNEDIPNSQPVPLEEDGRMPNVFYNGTARVILTDASGQIWDIGDVGQFGSGAVFDAWNNAIQYGLDDIVQGSDRNYYRSLININIGNDPTSSEAQWEILNFIRVWNVNVTYDIGNIVQDDAGNLYKSLTAVNLGNDPTSSPTDWAPAIESSAAWVLAGSVTPTGVSSFQITGIPATAVSIMIVQSVIGMVANDQAHLMRVMDDSVVQTTGYDFQGIDYQNSATPISLVSTTQFFLVEPNAEIGSSTQSGLGFLTKNNTTGVWQWSGTFYVSAGSFEPLWGMGNSPVISGVMNGLEFRTSGASNYDAGTVSVYYSEE